MLMTGEMVWQGEMLPGLFARVQRQDSWRENAPGSGRLEKGASLTLDIDLPRVGRVKIIGHQWGEQLDVTVRAPRQAQAGLKLAYPALQERLGACAWPADDPLAGNRMSEPAESLAVALTYQPGMPAPKVLSQGRGLLADAILQKAKELGIPTKSEPALVAFLMQLDVNDWVPPELFAAVAQVLAWAYEVDGSLSEKTEAVAETLKPPAS